MSKRFRFVNEAARRAYLALPPALQRQFGVDLNAVQHGERPFSDFKDISASVGPGAIELIDNGRIAYRAVYCAKFDDTVFILHAFTKTTRGVDRAAMGTARLRYGMMKAILRSVAKPTSGRGGRRS